MKKDLKDINGYIKDAISNIQDDRAVTKILLVDVLKYVNQSKENHKEIGNVAAKYVETLQRSNEQLVKIVSLLQKRNSIPQDLSDEDRDEIFDIIKEVS